MYVSDVCTAIHTCIYIWHFDYDTFCVRSDENYGAYHENFMQSDTPYDDVDCIKAFSQKLNFLLSDIDKPVLNPLFLLYFTSMLSIKTNS